MVSNQSNFCKAGKHPHEYENQSLAMLERESLSKNAVKEA
jgi:hypothetical protein